MVIYSPFIFQPAKYRLCYACNVFKAENDNQLYWHLVKDCETVRKLKRPFVFDPVVGNPVSKSDLSVEAMAAADADDFVEPPSKKKSHLKIGDTTEILVRTQLLVLTNNL